MRYLSDCFGSDFPLLVAHAALFSFRFSSRAVSRISAAVARWQAARLHARGDGHAPGAGRRVLLQAGLQVVRAALHQRHRALHGLQVSARFMDGAGLSCALFPLFPLSPS